MPLLTIIPNGAPGLGDLFLRFWPRHRIGRRRLKRDPAARGGTGAARSALAIIITKSQHPRHLAQMMAAFN